MLKTCNLAVKLAQVFKFTRSSTHPPHFFLVTTDFRQINLHGSSRVVVNQQIVIATSSYSTIIALAIGTGNNALVGNPFKERKGQHQVFQIFHLMKTGIFKSIPPSFLHAISTKRAKHARTDKLHDVIVSVAMSERSGKY